MMKNMMGQEIGSLNQELNEIPIDMLDESEEMNIGVESFGVSRPR